MSLGTLYSNGPLCPFTHRVLIARAELGLELDVRLGNIPDDVRRTNSSGTWPAFVPAAEGAMLEDSRDIVAHLVAAAGDRGAAYRSEPDLLAELDDLVTSISRVILIGAPASQAEFRASLESALATVDAELGGSGGPFLGGEGFSQADGHVTPFLYRLPFLAEIRGYTPPILGTSERLAIWVDQAVARPSFRQVAPPLNRLRHFYAERLR